MAFDGITIANITKELQETLSGGRVYKIAQPESDELLLTIKNNSSQYRLLLSANASLPVVYLTQNNKPSPMTAPGFCMLLRKHLQNARITDISQPGLERVIHLHLEHLNELGDVCRKKLIVEIMGKHSNIIFCDDKDMIIDSIKHISGIVSSVREVLPGRPYFLPRTQEKTDPLNYAKNGGNADPLSYEDFKSQMLLKPMPLYKALYTSYTGLSPIIAQEICFRAGVDADLPAKALAGEAGDPLKSVCGALSGMMSQVAAGNFSPVIVYDGRTPLEFAALPLTLYDDKDLRSFDSISDVLERYYAERGVVTRIRQKSADLRRIVQTALERNVKKYDLQLRQMQDTDKRDTYKIYGELLNTYGYHVSPGAKTLEAVNYYTGEPVLSLIHI